MDYVKPAEVAAAMVETGRRKFALPTCDLIIRGALAGAILGVATSLPNVSPMPPPTQVPAE